MKSIKSTILVLRTSDNLYLLIKRAGGDFHGNQWEFPGGKLEPGEEALQGAMRELREEVLGDYEVDNLKLFSEFFVPAHKAKYQGYSIHFFVFLANLNLPLVGSQDTRLRLSEEHQALALLPLSEVNNLNLTAEAKKVLSKLNKIPLE